MGVVGPVRFVTLALVAVLAAALGVVATAPQPTQAAGHEHCISDVADDVRDTAGTPVAGPAADILEVCAAYEPGALAFALRVADPTDPATDDSWTDGSTRIAWLLQSEAQAYGEPSGQLALRWQDGQLRATATWFDDQTPVCEGSGELDGDWYRASFDPGCLDVPATVSYAATILYDADPGTVGAPAWTDRAPDGMHSEGVGRWAGPVTRSDTAPPFDRLSGRFAGATRIDTAVAVSRAEFPHGAEEVYLARQDDFPDALAAGSTMRGPILLVRHCTLPQSVAFEIQRLGPQRVIALGGEVAICDAVLDEARRLETLAP